MDNKELERLAEKLNILKYNVESCKNTIKESKSKKNKGDNNGS
jgi:hypothetical protein